MKVSESAGGVVLNSRGQVLVVNQNGDSWSLPKGHLDPGENALEAAQREIREEAGVCSLELLGELGSYERSRIGLGGTENSRQMKRITLFLFRALDETLNPQDKEHHPEARWVERGEVAALLTHSKDKIFFQSILKLLP